MNLIQKVNLSQSNMTFGKLIPKAKYNGVPNLSQQAINGIKTLRALLVKTEGDIIEIKGKMSRMKLNCYLEGFLKSKLDVLEMYKIKLEYAIRNIRKTKQYKPRNIDYMEAAKERKLRQIEGDF